MNGLVRMALRLLMRQAMTRGRGAGPAGKKGQGQLNAREAGRRAGQAMRIFKRFGRF